MKKIAAFLCVFAVLSGCGWYRPPSSPLQYRSRTQALENPYPARLAVMLPEDKRGKDSYNRIPMLYVVPFIVSAGIAEDRIERTQYLSKRANLGYPKGFFPAEFLQKAVAEELRQSNLFKEISVVPLGEEPEGADLVLRGELLSTRFSAKGRGYLFPPLTAILHFMGLPMFTISQEVKIKLELLKPEGGRPIWSGAVDAKMAATGGFYYHTGKAAEYYRTNPWKEYRKMWRDFKMEEHNGQILNDLLAQGMSKTTPELARFLGAKPYDFREKLELEKAMRILQGEPQPQ